MKGKGRQPRCMKARTTSSNHRRTAWRRTQNEAQTAPNLQTLRNARKGGQGRRKTVRVETACSVQRRQGGAGD